MKVTVHIHDWAGTNNLTANLNKYADIVFVDNKRRRKLEIQPPPPLPNINGVTDIKFIGVTFTNTRSVAEHTHRIISSHAQALYALRVLRTHCVDDSSLHIIYRSVIISKLTFASSAWWGSLAQPTASYWRCLSDGAIVVAAFHPTYQPSQISPFPPMRNCLLPL